MTFEPRKKLRIIVLVHEDLVPPNSLNGLSDKEKLEVKTEYDVISTLKKMGHEVYPVGLYNQLNVIGNALMEHKPHIAFNLLEEFHGYPLYDQHVVSYLELMKQAYTGCNPRGMTLAHDKALTKMILSYHRLLVPNFAVFPMNRKVRRPKRSIRLSAMSVAINMVAPTATACVFCDVRSKPAIAKMSFK